ncbi:hypothetical protein GCM10022226_63030 [Sphaerisporangium flaviroseum]|uniref:Asp23/Gls24 family envelope stress response protein n=1 Tax=Sphaerisporangium flaviroseum TaxID=509199 RepID=A0ABP7J2J0_9ACTN
MTDAISTEESTVEGQSPDEEYAEPARAFPDGVPAPSPVPGHTLGESPMTHGGNGASGAGGIAEDPYPTSGVRGRIKVADEVVEKVAALAALEITGVADLGGDLERALESVRDRIGVGSKRPDQGVRAHIENAQVTVDVTIVIEYGHIVMQVAGDVKINVARTVSHMLGMRVVEVNVTVDDVRLPGEPQQERPDGDHVESF